MNPRFSTMIALLIVALAAKAGIPPIEGENTVGFAAVAAPGAATTILTIPFEACMGGGMAGMLSDLVATHGLTSHADNPAAADQLVVLTQVNNEPVYYYYWLQAGQGWTGIDTQQLMPVGPPQVLTPPLASEFPISRGLGFWIKRPAANANPVYLKGQVATSAQSTEIAPGLNLVGYGAVESFNLNDLNWGGANGGTGNTATSDRIIVVNADGTFTEYFFFVLPEGPAWAPYASLDNKWITRNYEIANVSMPAGRGFWYHRRAGNGFLFRPEGVPQE